MLYEHVNLYDYYRVFARAKVITIQPRLPPTEFRVKYTCMHIVNSSVCLVTSFHSFQEGYHTF
jgi:hypothetical protein